MAKKTSIPPDFDITKATREEVRRMRNSPDWNDFELRELIRLGFYTPEVGLNKQDLTKRVAELNTELQILNEEITSIKEQTADLQDQTNAIDRAKERQKERHKKRLAESMTRRAEAKEKRLQTRKEKREAWAIKKQKELLHIGNENSANLHNRTTDTKSLEKDGLPVIQTDEQLLNLINQFSYFPDSVVLRTTPTERSTQLF